MLRTSEEKRPVKRMHLSGSVAPDLNGPVRDRKKEFSGARSNYPVVISGTPESRPGPADDNERSTLATPSYVVGSWSSFPTGDVIRSSHAEEIDFHPRMGVSAVSDFAEGEFTYTYSGRELSQEPGEIAQMAPTSTPSPVSLREQYGFSVESPIELGNEPGHSGIHYLLPSASIPSERANPRDPSLVVKQLLARGWAHPSGRVYTADWGTVSRHPSPLSGPFPVVADRLLEGLSRHSVSDLNVAPKVHLSLRPTRENSGGLWLPPNCSKVGCSTN